MLLSKMADFQDLGYLNLSSVFELFSLSELKEKEHFSHIKIKTL